MSSLGGRIREHGLALVHPINGIGFQQPSHKLPTNAHIYCCYSYVVCMCWLPIKYSAEASPIYCTWFLGVSVYVGCRGRGVQVDSVHHTMPGHAIERTGKKRWSSIIIEPTLDRTLLE